MVSTGPLSVPLFLFYGLTKGAFLATEAASSLGLYLSKSVTFERFGALTPDVALKGLIAGSSLMFGAFIAKRFVLHLEPDVFRLIMDGIMLAAGLSLLWTAIFMRSGRSRRSDLNQLRRTADEVTRVTSDSARPSIICLTRFALNRHSHGETEMNRGIIGAIVAVVVILIIAAGSWYTVDQTERGVLLALWRGHRHRAAWPRLQDPADRQRREGQRQDHHLSRGTR